MKNKSKHVHPKDCNSSETKPKETRPQRDNTTRRNGSSPAAAGSASRRMRQKKRSTARNGPSSSMPSWLASAMPPKRTRR